MRPLRLNDQTRPGTLFNRGAMKSGAIFKAQARSGALFNRLTMRSSAVAQRGKIFLSRGAGAGRNKHGAAFAGVYLFTLMLYARPNDLIPALGSFPLVKIVAIGILLIYIGSKIYAHDGLIVWTTEMTALMVMAALGVILMPLAASPKDSLDTLTDTYLKTVIMFILMVNLIDTRRRIFLLWKLVVICGAVLSLGAIKSYAKGEFTMQGLRIEGLVGGMFENPNDLATALDLLLPLAVALALISKGVARVFYVVCAAVMAIGVLVTFSRGGFLGLIALGGLLLWKLGRGRRLKITLAGALICGVLLASTPGNYGSRIATIFNIEQDQTGSAQLRRELAERAALIAIRRPLLAIGMGNFHIYSIDEHVAHNSYLEIAAELGVIGLIAYLILIFAPFRSLRRIEAQTVDSGSKSERELHWLSVSIQAAFVAYMVCSFFASIQYLWYLYYTAAYAVALRRIHAAEEKESLLSNNQVPAPTPIAKPARGALWPAHRLRQGIGR
ncbi:MAG: O-antigen ligase family protein [Blastocatellia bacterium]